MKCNLFYLALWVNKAEVKIEHFNTSLLGVLNHTSAQYDNQWQPPRVVLKLSHRC